MKLKTTQNHYLHHHLFILIIF